eukprot:TRINITY_DN17555_c0_g2_i1.p1 TRINITY_DN17555_c0_g2~~TRINITY_DN17555_c0_g2_i1.p1  ORF type:complete len:139 (+),score=45.23 TRINITY_DN17555_c0_g2_i1:100-516(+)
MNEWEGDEKHDVKIEKYTRADIKRLSSRNEKVKEEEIIKAFNKLIIEQKATVEKLSEDYKELEKKVVFQAEIIQACKKCVENEWDKKKEKLKEKLREKCSKEFKEVLSQRMDAAIKEKIPNINKVLMEIIANKLKVIQ